MLKTSVKAWETYAPGRSGVQFPTGPPSTAHTLFTYDGNPRALDCTTDKDVGLDKALADGKLELS